MVSSALRSHERASRAALTVVREHHGRERAERGEKDDMGVWPFFWEANNYKIVVDAEGTAATHTLCGNNGLDVVVKSI